MLATQDPDERKGIVFQIEALRAHASKQRHEVAEDYVCCDAGYSGVSLDRPGLIQLRHGVQAKAFDAVLILSPDQQFPLACPPVSVQQIQRKPRQ